MALGPLCALLFVVAGVFTAIATVVWGLVTTVVPLPGGIESFLAQNGSLALGMLAALPAALGGKIVYGLLVVALFATPLLQSAVC